MAGTADRPAECGNSCRLEIVRKRLEVRDRDQLEFFADYRYFLYLTNDGESTPEEIVFSTNDRCQQIAGFSTLSDGLWRGILFCADIDAVFLQP